MSATDSTVQTSNPVENKPPTVGEGPSTVDAGQKRPVNTGEAPSANWHQQACAEAVRDHARTLLTKTSEDGLVAAKAVVIRSDRLWDNGLTLTFGFMVNGPVTPFQGNQQTKVRTVITEWQKYANIIFNYVEDAAAANIRITFNPDSGSWSFVGKEVMSISSDKPTMNLGWIDGSTDLISANEKGVILHEFGHTLGLMHEHQSPLRGSKLTLKKDAVIRFYTKDQGWSEKDVQQQILDVYNERDVSNYSEVDLTSIMQYFMPPELNEQNIRVEPNNKLSEMDQAFMIINYPIFVPSFVDVKAGKSDPSLRAKFEGALDVVGVDGRTKVLILQHYDAQDWAQIRYEFSRFCVNRRIARQPKSPEEGRLASFSTDPESIIADGCLSDVDVGAADASKGVATVDADLWLPGTRITYSWVQGGLDATKHRKKVVRDTFASYASRVNLTFEEVPFDPKNLNAKIHFYFGEIPVPGVTGWSKIGRKSEGYRQTLEQIQTRGGTVESSIVLSDLAVPKVASTDDAVIKREQRTLFHEIGHALGLKHEHASPNTVTTDTIDPNFSVATIFDDTSVMLYANRKFRKGASFPALKDYFDPSSTKFNHMPSKLDLAFLGALYPNRSGHVDDHFASDLKTLGLSGSMTSLTALRDAAFAVEGHPEFADHIRKYRQALQAKLTALVPARTIITAAHAPVPPSSPARALAAPAQATTGSFVDELVKTLQALFKPTTGQMFALQFPGRFLQQDLYAWDTSSAGIYGQFVKPTVVNESEFRLVDQLYNVGSVIGAPSGINLSIVYEQCLNNLVPGVPESSVHFMKQQSKIRQWLLKDVPTSGWVTDLIKSQHSQSTGFNQGGFQPVGTADPGFSAKAPSRAIGAPGKIKTDAKSSSDTLRPVAASSAINPDAKPQFALADKLAENGKVNRMELADALMQEYLAAKQAWELERDEMIRNADGEDMDALTRRLAHITSIRQAQLAAKHADAVVRGYSHAVRQYLGFLDVKTPAEMLQDAKDALRESAMSSLDGSMKVYPVQMSPIDWFQSLSTSFTMEDLTVNADIIAQQLQSKSKQLDMLNARLSVIQSKPKIDLTELQSKLDAAQITYDKVQSDLTTTYTNNIISLAKTFIDSSNKFQYDDFKVQALTSPGVNEDMFKNIQVGMDKLTAAQLNIAQSSRALTYLMSQKSLAEASDTTQEVVETQVQIKSLTKDVEELTTRLQSLRYNPKAAPTDPANSSIKDTSLFPSTSGGSRWQDIVMKHKIDSLYSASSDQSKAANSKTNLSLFFGSYQSENSSSSGSSESVNLSQSVEVEIGFRATMVTVDRGGWFQPQFFKQSAGFNCIDPNISWSKWPDNVKSVHDLTPDNVAAFTELNKHLLPAFPVAFLVCKDITIRVHMDSTDMRNSSSVLEKYAANSGGVLCWSTSSSEHEKSADKSHAFDSKSDGAVIRIPGPQILGYVLQFTDSDQSKVISENLPDGFLLSDADYNSSFADKPATASHAVDPSVPPSGPPPKAAEPAKPESAPVPAPKN